MNLCRQVSVQMSSSIPTHRSRNSSAPIHRRPNRYKQGIVWRACKFDPRFASRSDRHTQMVLAASLSLMLLAWPAIAHGSSPGLGLGMARPQPAGGSWHVEQVDGSARGHSALDLDRNGHPYISYEADGPGYQKLMVAHWTGNHWALDDVDNLQFGGVTALQLDTAGGPHLGYSICNPFSCAFRYARWTGSDWLRKDFSPPMVSGASLSLALDSKGQPHFAYCLQRPTLEVALEYAHWTGKEWTTEAVDPGGCWSSTSISVDSQDRPHISYHGDEKAELRYARRMDGAWQIQTVDSEGDVGDHNALALDAEGNPHISYYDASRHRLKYAEWTGSNWLIQAVDQGDQVGSNTSLALDTEGRPHISYYTGTNQGIKYAHYTGTAWTIELVDVQTGEGDSTSIALDAEGRPHLSYYAYRGEADHAVQYAWREGPGQPQPPSPVVPEAPTLVLGGSAILGLAAYAASQLRSRRAKP